MASNVDPADTGPSLTSGEEFSSPELANIWKTVLRPGMGEDERFAGKYFNWRRPLSVQGLLGQPRMWTSWGYRAAYPKLALFMEKASIDRKFRTQVILEEFETKRDEYLFGKLRYNEAHAPLSDIFDALKTFPSEAVSIDQLGARLEDTPVMARLARIVHMTDLSPLVLSCVLGTSSSLIVSHIAAFIEKYLNSANWAKVNLLQIKGMSWSTFTYEYHMSFFYVTHEYFDNDTIKPDPRGVRKSCPFGQPKDAKHRYIHEESVSFLLCGHFDEVVTCYQLADAYYKPRYVKSTGPLAFRSFDPKQSPGQVLLYWIAMALFHARSRWEFAIDALDAEIRSPSDVVFMNDRDDLMADDPQFSLSKTYFWALQTYKLFERTLEQTILAWDNFKIHSLPKVQDGRISRQDWDVGISSIEQGMEHLKLKIVRVRRGMQDVRDLREGLQSTAAVFDSRTSVRQGENIRLLTYITILFLPLSFGTSIFGMQIIHSNAQTVKAFAITLPSITVITALLIINLESMMAISGSTFRRFTSSLQEQMRSHHRTNWKAKAHALQQDHLATRPPARKITRQSSHWVYILFVIEAILVLVPVAEVAAAFNCYGIISSSDDGDEDAELSDDDPDPRSRKRTAIQQKVNSAVELARREENKRKLEGKGPVSKLFHRIGTGSTTSMKALLQAIFTLSRAILLPVWILLLTLELAAVLSTLLLFGHNEETWANSKDCDSSASEEKSSSKFRSAWKILCLDTIKLPKLRTSSPTQLQNDEMSQQPEGQSIRDQKGKVGRISRAPEKAPMVQAATTTRHVQEGESPIANVRPQGQLERVTWLPSQSQASTLRKMHRAVDASRHGGGYIPGDSFRGET